LRINRKYNGNPMKLNKRLAEACFQLFQKTSHKNQALNNKYPSGYHGERGV
jgi:hypothetical protein